MPFTIANLTRARKFAAAVDPTVPKVDEALPHIRTLLDRMEVDYLFVGGIAVVHHGYVRATVDIDVLMNAADLTKLDGVSLQAAHFHRPRPHRLVHEPTAVPIDLLISGRPMPRPDAPPYPAPNDLPKSSSDPKIVALEGLVTLKLYARRRQNEADIVRLLKNLNDGEYLALEAKTEVNLRPLLTELRRDALEELAWEAQD